MIDARELKIGNLIYSKVGKIIGQNEPIKVEINHLKHIFEGNEYGYEFIPLSEEWFIKAEFEKTGKQTYNKEYLPWTYQIEKHPSFKEGYILFIDVPGIAAPPSIKLRYVHDLQNAWKVFTNSELTFKL